MKTSLRFGALMCAFVSSFTWHAVALCVGGSFLLASPSAFPQGSLTPPGAPTPTMKSLDQIASTGIAINATNTPGDANSLFKITQSGSYYLAGNITGVSSKHGIQIAADNVSIDLMGFTLQGVAGSLDGIGTDAAHKNLNIRNGTVADWRQDGIDLTINNTVLGTGSLVEHVLASGNSSHGIVVGNAGIVRSCVAANNISDGIKVNPNATVESCLAYFNTGIGISASSNCSILNCSCHSNTGGGIRLLGGCTVLNCSTISNSVAGIFTLNSGCLIQGCVASFNSNDGISLGGFSGSTVRGCTCYLNSGGAGIVITTNSTDCRIEGNNCTSNATGIRAVSAGNIIIRNTCSGNIANNWDIAIGNAVAPIVSATTNTIAITGNTYSGNLGSTDPNANFTF